IISSRTPGSAWAGSRPCARAAYDPALIQLVRPVRLRGQPWYEERSMALEFPRTHLAALHDLGTRLLDSRKPGTDLQTIARDLLAGFFEISLQSGLDGMLLELGLDVDD